MYRSRNSQHGFKVNANGYYLMLAMFKNRFGVLECAGGAFIAKKEEEYHLRATESILELAGLDPEQFTCVRTDGCYSLNNAALQIFGEKKTRRFVCSPFFLLDFSNPISAACTT
jgi:hypothetical protein